METSGQSPTYQYTPQWNTQNTLSGGYSPYPTTSAGDLLSSLVPDYSNLNTRYPASSTSGVDSFNVSAIPTNVINPPAPTTSSSIPRNRSSSYNSRPNFGRSRSYPNGRLGMPNIILGGFLLRKYCRSASMAIKLSDAFNYRAWRYE
jgi:hypothetical protein